MKLNPPVKIISAAQCPLCGQPNHCQLCTNAAYKGPCWCAQMEIPEALLAQVPPEFKNRNCVCRDCVTQFQRAKKSGLNPKILPGDFYFENGWLIFTAQYHLRRGFCCGNDCRHCPYKNKMATA